jgi:hypothetical protein
MEYFEAFDGGHVIDLSEYRAARGARRGRPRGCRQTEEAKSKIREAQRGEKNSMFGRRQKRRTRLLQSEAARRHWQLRREVIARMEAREAAMRGNPGRSSGAEAKSASLASIKTL